MTLGLVDVSEPLPGAEGLRHVTARSGALGHRADVTLYAPPGYDQLPLVILLHGVYGSHWNWATNGQAPATLSGLVASGQTRPMALAMPSDGLRGDGSGYLPNPGEDAEAWIAEEVPELAGRVLGNLTGETYIAGLSMGGFGAVRTAFLHPGRFRAAAGMSSITRAEEMVQFISDGPGALQFPPGTGSLLEVISASTQELPLHLDCGADDHLLEANRALHDGLVEAGVAHEYEEHPGGHTWGYWRDRLPAVLRFFDRQRAASA